MNSPYETVCKATDLMRLTHNYLKDFGTIDLDTFIDIMNLSTEYDIGDECDPIAVPFMMELVKYMKSKKVLNIQTFFILKHNSKSLKSPTVDEIKQMN